MTNNNYKQIGIGELPEKWELTTLGKLADITSSKRIFASEYLSHGVPFFRGKEIVEKNAGSSVSTELYISEQKYNEIDDRFGVPKENDILLTSVGTLGVPYRVAPDDKFYFKDGNITWFRNLDVTTSEFLFQWLNSDFGKRRLIEKSIGSTQQALTIIALKSIEIALPPIDERKQIASILSSFDNKIELNRKMNKTLEEMGKVLFKRWFVDFEFPDKQGKPYRTNGGEMVNSELGIIPRGWDVVMYDSIIDICGGGTPKTTVDEYWNGSIPFYTPKDSNNDLFVVETEKNVTDLGVKKSSTKIYPEDTVFITARGTVGNINMAGVPMAMNQSCYALVGKHAYLTYLLTANKVQELIQRTHGAVFSTITTSTFQSIKIAWPKTELVDKFSQTITPLFDLIKKNTKENMNLSQARERLLPRLMSGKIRVSI